jgi:hypothetical protein
MLQEFSARDGAGALQLQRWLGQIVVGGLTTYGDRGGVQDRLVLPLRRLGVNLANAPHVAPR